MGGTVTWRRQKLTSARGLFLAAIRGAPVESYLNNRILGAAMDERTVSRRQAVGLVGFGLASAAGGVMAQQETPTLSN
jgi:hypothetical protein